MQETKDLSGLISFEEYQGLGFATVPESEFERFLAAASAAVRRFTFGRVSRETLTRSGMYGICEIIDIYYNDDGVTGFSNDGYSESYIAKDVSERVSDIIGMYFESGEVWRGAVAR